MPIVTIFIDVVLIILISFWIIKFIFSEGKMQLKALREEFPNMTEYGLVSGFAVGSDIIVYWIVTEDKSSEGIRYWNVALQRKQGINYLFYRYDVTNYIEVSSRQTMNDFIRTIYEIK